MRLILTMECREQIFRLPLQQQQDRLLFYGKKHGSPGMAGTCWGISPPWAMPTISYGGSEQTLRCLQIIF